MRIDRLALTAFGPFTDEVLDLSAGAPGGVHVIYGPNEAGKSTSLRAVSALLFGIPARTVDAHLHPYGRLSISADLCDGTRRLSLTRLKKKKDGLRNAEGAPVDPNELAEMLGYIDESSFTRRFGLDQRELEQGAEALLGGSEEGLFAAGTAGSVVRQVLDELDRECDELFKRQGSKPLLNRALSAYAEAQRIAKQSVRTPDAYVKQKKAHDQALAEARSLNERLLHVRAERKRLLPLSQLLSELRRLDDVEAALAKHASIPRLSPDAAERRGEAERKLREAQLSVQRFEEDSSDTQRRLEEVPDPGPLALLQDESLDLRDRLGRARSAREDLPKRQASLEAAQQSMARALSRLGHSASSEEALVTARDLIPNPARHKRIHGLVADRSGLQKECEQAERECRKAERELTEASENAAEPCIDVSTVQAALAEAKACQPILIKLGELDQRKAQRGRRIDAARVRLGRAAVLAGAARGTEPEVVEAASALWQGQVEKLQQSQTELARDQVELEETSARLQQLKAAADIPTEERLGEVRKRRNALLDQLAVAERRDPRTIEGLRVVITEADELSDRLRREADRVAELRELELKQAGVLARKRARGQQVELYGKQIEEQMRRTVAPFASMGLEVHTPEEARQLGRELAEVAELEAEQADDALQRDRLVACIDKARGALVEACRTASEGHEAEEMPSAEGLVGAIAWAEELVEVQREQKERARHRAERLARARSALAEAQERRARAEAQLISWQKRFDEAVAGLGGDQRLDVVMAQDVLSELSELREELSDAEGLVKRIEGIRRDNESFDKEVRRLCERHAPDLLGRDAVDAAERFIEQIANAKRAQEERVRLNRVKEERRQQLRQAQTEAQAAQAELGQLLRDAGAEDLDQLRRIEDLSRKAVQLDAERAELLRDLSQKGQGRPLEELRTEARGVSHNQLAARIDELEEERDSLDQEHREAESEAERLQEYLKSFGSDDVALARQRANDRAAAAQALLRRYLTLRAAQVVLKDQMARYADRFAGPIAHKAGELFRRLTLGKYEKLSIGVGENTIRMVREGQELEVAQLSRGTRAQLYLALRLASLETYFETQKVIPLVFDDLFVDFDDDRATAAFEILGEMAQRVQILYFTHLGRDVEAAQNGVPGHLLFQHRVGLS